MSLNIASVHDIHLAHPRTPTKHIVDCLMQDFPDNAVTAALDWLVIPGDVFDGIVTVGSPDHSEIIGWICNLLMICAKHDIVLDVLEGTPSHDRNQSKLFVDLNESNNIGCNLTYVESLSVLYKKEFDINVLYIPDRCRPNCSDIWEDVCAIMSDLGLEKVDYALMHGLFEYHLKPGFEVDTHLTKNYLPIVNKYIFIGHDHRQIQHKHILGAGSYARLKHGEHGAKGHYRVSVNDNGLDDITFKENKRAIIFDDLDVQGLSLAEVHAAIQALDLPPLSRVRLVMSRDDVCVNMYRNIEVEYGDYVWSTLIKPKEVAISAKDSEVSHVYVGATVTKSNIVEMLAMDELTADEHLLNNALRLLKEVL